MPSIVGVRMCAIQNSSELQVCWYIISLWLLLFVCYQFSYNMYANNQSHTGNLYANSSRLQYGILSRYQIKCDSYAMEYVNRIEISSIRFCPLVLPRVPIEFTICDYYWCRALCSLLLINGASRFMLSQTQILELNDSVQTRNIFDTFHHCYSLLEWYNNFI